MITDLCDLGPVIDQYDPGSILVGPVRRLPSSGYSYFYIAASGSKIYEAIGLGFFENELDAESQRANTVAILKSHFKEILTFGSHYEMARAVDTLWSNDESVKVLASATEEAVKLLASATEEAVKLLASATEEIKVLASTTPATKPESDAVPLGGSIDRNNRVHKPSDQSQTSRLLSGATAITLDPSDRPQDVSWLGGARRLAALLLLTSGVGASGLFIWSMLGPTAPRVTHKAEMIAASQPVTATALSPIAAKSTESIKSTPDPAVPDPAVMAPSTPRAAHSEQQVMSRGSPQRLEPAPASAALSAAPQQSGGVSAQAEQAPNARPEQQGMTQGLPGPSPAPQQPSGGVSTQTKTLPDASPEQQVMSNGPLEQVKPAAAAIAPSPPRPSRGASPQAKLLPSARPPEQEAMTKPVAGPQATPALRLDSQEITTLIDRGTALVKVGDLESARLVLRRAAEGGSAEAALMLGSTFDPLIFRQLGVIGIEPDVTRARQWYEKAAELGSDAASQRLANLEKH